MKGISRIAIAGLLITVIVAVLASQRTQDKSKSERWKEDVLFYKSYLETNHINLYHTISKSIFTQELEALIEKIPALNDQEIMVEMMRITRAIGDGHTQFSAMGGPHNHYPLSLDWIEGAIRVMATSEDHKALLGARLVAIDGVPLVEVLKKIDPVMQGIENKQSLQAAYRWHLNVSELLYGLRITRSPGTATFTFVDDLDQEVEATVSAIFMQDFTKKISQRMVLPRGVFSSPAIKESDGLWLSSDSKLKAAYIHFSRYPSRGDMESFADKVRNYIQDKNIQNLIIDLRGNGGGDFFVGLTLANYLILIDSLNWNDGIYCLIGKHTFSAGMSNAAQYRSILNATLVGEPTGANPVGYQDADGFTLPNSKRYIQYSKRMYKFQSDDTEGVIPDHYIENDWDSYKTGHDKQLDYVISLIKKSKGDHTQ